MLFTLTASPLAEWNVAEPSGYSTGMLVCQRCGRQTKGSLATEIFCPLVFRNKWFFICKNLWP